MDLRFSSRYAYLTSLLSTNNTSPARFGKSQDSTFCQGLDTMSITAGCLSHLKKLGGRSTSGSDGATVFQSSEKVPTVCVRKGERQPLSAEAQETLQKTVENLKSTLEKDEAFLNKSNRSFFDSPVARQLVTTMILADPDLQDQVAKKIWEGYDSRNQISRSRPGLQYGIVELPENYQDIDVPAMLRSQDKEISGQVFFAFDSVMVNKARTTGLTDTERLLSAWYTQIDFATHATFDDKVQPVLGQIEKEFQENGLEFDKNKLYSFNLDTSDFTFTVSGGTEQENELMAKVMNTKNIWGHSYDTDNMNTVINALLSHRREDGSYNPWSSAAQMDTEAKAEEIRKHGIADTPKEYEAKMKQLDSAYHWYRLDQSMKRYYGIGVDDLEYKAGKIIGKTDQANAVLEKGGADFMKTKGCAYIELVNQYSGTPTFESPAFILNGGKFQVTYAAM